MRASTEALQLTGGNSNNNNNRRELDFYPTPPDVTHALMRFLNIEPCVIWEPACGDGSMSQVISQYGHRVISSDLRQSGYGENGIDFLKSHKKCDAIITNPPFNISADFIKHAVEIAPLVAMVLKSQYWHAQKRMSLFDEYKPAYILPLTWRLDFMNGERGGSPTMEVMWTVWKLFEYDTKYIPLKRP